MLKQAREEVARNAAECESLRDQLKEFQASMEQFQRDIAVMKSTMFGNGAYSIDLIALCTPI